MGISGYGRETIAAISTPAGKGGISIIRISGPRAWEVGRIFFVGKENKKIGKPSIGKMLHGHIVDPKNGNVMDEVYIVFFKGPKSYTTEDIVEIQGHGGSVISSMVLEKILENGCRLAQPGEFTLRAFLGGRISLDQAEAVGRLIDSETQEEARVSIDGLQCGTGKTIGILRDRIVKLIAELEAVIDFPDEVEEGTNERLIGEIERKVIGRIEGLLEENRRGKVSGGGAKVVIAGKTNVGKSMLFNKIVGKERALVSEIEGTTRDFIEKRVNLEGITIELVDTAGRGEFDDELNRRSIEAGKKRIKTADLVICVIDGSGELDEIDEQLIREDACEKRIFAINKKDLRKKVNEEEIKVEERKINVSAKTGEGVDELLEEIREILKLDAYHSARGEIYVSLRQEKVLRKLEERARSAVGLLSGELKREELASKELQEGLELLGEIDGVGAEEKVIEEIFSKFCVGK